MCSHNVCEKSAESMPEWIYPPTPSATPNAIPPTSFTLDTKKASCPVSGLAFFLASHDAFRFGVTWWCGLKLKACGVRMCPLLAEYAAETWNPNLRSCSGTSFSTVVVLEVEVIVEEASVVKVDDSGAMNDGCLGSLFFIITLGRIPLDRRARADESLNNAGFSRCIVVDRCLFVDSVGWINKADKRG